MSGILRVAGESRTNRDIQLSAVGKDNETTPRWAVRADSLEEAGDNTGANLQFVRYGDDGEVLDSPSPCGAATVISGLARANPTPSSM